ncbi:DUF4334 domain-containing protein [Mycobacterium sp. RTGN3]|uniref:DUF4334 domain-containing protein n=1 Tax=unclassified Mycobacterium TaxID=2642494 RepID=UPI0039B0E7B5
MNLFDRLPTVSVDGITTGRWRGEELLTGHPLDNLLTAGGWYGKQFDGPEFVHPLLFKGPLGKIFAVDPRKAPMQASDRVPAKAVKFGRYLLPALATRKPRARLRNLEYRGKTSAAMIYDDLPIIDIFRRVADDTLLGVMDNRAAPLPYFFILHRE